eukprot:IDg28t1
MLSGRIGMKFSQFRACLLVSIEILYLGYDNDEYLCSTPVIRDKKWRIFKVVCSISL